MRGKWLPRLPELLRSCGERGRERNRKKARRDSLIFSYLPDLGCSPRREWRCMARWWIVITATRWRS